MAEQKPDSVPKQRDTKKRIKRLSSERLEAGLSTHYDNEWAKQYVAEMEAATTLEEKRAVHAEHMGRELDEEEEAWVANWLDDDPEAEALAEAQADPSKTPSWLSTPEEVSLAEAELASRREPAPSQGELHPHSARKPKSGNRNKWIRERRRIVKKHKDLPAKELIILFDEAKIPLPPGPDWKPHSKADFPWASAYDDLEFDCGLRQCIFQIVAHDKQRS